MFTEEVVVVTPEPDSHGTPAGSLIRMSAPVLSEITSTIVPITVPGGASTTPVDGGAPPACSIPNICRHGHGGEVRIAGPATDTVPVQPPVPPIGVLATAGEQLSKVTSSLLFATIEITSPVIPLVVEKSPSVGVTPIDIISICTHGQPKPPPPPTQQFLASNRAFCVLYTGCRGVLLKV